MERTGWRKEREREREREKEYKNRLRESIEGKGDGYLDRAL
jgi:hypothetical protein